MQEYYLDEYMQVLQAKAVNFLKYYYKIAIKHYKGSLPSPKQLFQTLIISVGWNAMVQSLG